MELQDKGLFLRYAIPCSRVLIKRGWVRKEVIDGLLRKVLNNIPVEEDLGEIFMFAHSMCSFLAERGGKAAIDRDVIREYFWKEHDSAARERSREFSDFDLTACRVLPGMVVALFGMGASVEVVTPKGQGRYKNIYREALHPGDFITVHYDVIAEKITAQDAKDLWEEKKKYFNEAPTFPSE